jgi:acetyl esterase/lipase
MKRTFLLLIILTLCCTGLKAQLLTWQDIMKAETAIPDHIISYGPDSLQFGELWIPDREPVATVIMIHGGCWLSQYPGTKLMHLIAEDLRANGFTVWNLEYRRVGHEGGGYPGTFLDIAKGADHLRKLAEEYSMSLQRVIAAGHSAGGHLASWLAGRKNIPQSSPLYMSNPIPVGSVISLAGINDLPRYADYAASPCGERTVERLVHRDERGESAYLDTSPSELLPLAVPLLEVSAAFDEPVPPFFGFQFSQKAAESGDKAKHVLLTQSGHYEMIHSKSEEWKKIRSHFIRFAAQ